MHNVPRLQILVFHYIKQPRKSNKCRHLFYKIYKYTCTEEAIKIAAKYLQHKMLFQIFQINPHLVHINIMA